MSARICAIIGLFFICGFIGSSSAQGKSALLVGGGLLAYQMGKITTADNGARAFYGRVYPTLAVTTRIAFLEPWVAYTPFGKATADDVGKSHFFSITVPIVFDFSRLFVRLGPGLQLYMLSGQGGSVSLGNGTGTSTFGRPGGSVSAKNLILDLGLGFEPSDQLSLDFDLLVASALTGRRSASGVLRLSFGVM